MSYNAQHQMEINEAKLRAWAANYGNYVQSISKPNAVVFLGGVTGITYHQYFRFKDYIKNGSELFVKPDPQNQFDANATGIWFKKDNGVFEQIGWIPKALNRVAAKAWKDGYQLYATVERHNPSHGDNNQKLIISVTLKKSEVNYAFTSGVANPVPEVEGRRFVPTTNTSPIQSQKEPIMANKVNAIIEQNLSLGTSAAFLEAGRIANNQLSGMASKKLPIMVRAYADTALGRLLLANVALMARDHFRPNDERLGKLVNAMTVSAYQEVLQTFDIEQMIEDLIANKTIVKALKTFDKVEERD